MLIVSFLFKINFWDKCEQCLRCTVHRALVKIGWIRLGKIKAHIGRFCFCLYWEGLLSSETHLNQDFEGWNFNDQAKWGDRHWLCIDFTFDRQEFRVFQAHSSNNWGGFKVIDIQKFSLQVFALLKKVIFRVESKSEWRVTMGLIFQ